VPSDQLFKEFLKEFFPEFFALFFSHEAAQLQLETLRFLDKEVFTDFPQGDVREADLIAEVQTKTGEPEIVLIHIEVQAKRNPDFSFRMWQYYNLIRLRYGKPVFPLVVYLAKGSGGLTTEEHTEIVLGRPVSWTRYAVVGIPDMTAEEWADKSGAVSAALASLMISPRGKQARRAFDSLKTVLVSPLPEARKLLLSQIIDRLARDRMSASQEQEYTILLASEEAQEIKPMISTFEERGIERGEIRGIARTSLRQLRHKFGASAITLTNVIESLNVEELDAFAEALLDFTTLNEAREWLENHKNPLSSVGN
jgi:Domain of unknown function (DUF4351)